MIGLINELFELSLLENRVMDMRNVLRKTAKLSADELITHQLIQLKFVIEYASHHIPWYRSKFGRLNMAAIDHQTIQQLPILTRSQVQQKTELLTNRNSGHPGLRIIGSNTTSGSTGSPLKTEQSFAGQNVFNAIRDRFHDWGGRNGNRKMAFITTVTPAERGQFPHGSHGGPWRPNCPLGTTATLTLAAPIEQQLEWLVRENPDYLSTYPSNAEALLALAREKGVRLPNLRDVIVSSEKIPDHLEQECQELWGATLTRTYSANEVGGIALGHRNYSGYLVQSENVYVEIVNDNGKPCQVGEPGRILITTLQNGLRPLIRYEIGDYGEFGERHEGIGYPVITRITGRERNLMTLPNGQKVWPFFPAEEFRQLGVKQWQLIQASTSHLRARVVVADKFTPEEEATFGKTVNKHLPSHFDVTIEYVDRVDRTANRKFEDFINQYTSPK